MSAPARFLDTSAGRVFVQRPAPGRGPALVMLHGFMMDGWYWRGMMPSLCRTHDPIAIDLPGFGESDRPRRFGYDFAAYASIVEEVMDKLGVARAQLCGHSLGGGVALTLAARRPERVERLALIAPAIFPLPIPTEGKILMVPRLGEFLWNFGVTRGEMRRHMIRIHFRNREAVTDEFVDHVWQRFNRAGGRAAAWAALQPLLRLQPTNADPMRVRAPTAIFWGDEDRMTPIEHGRRLTKLIPGAQLRIIPACGHSVTLERPDELVRQMVPFLTDETLRPVAETPVPPARAQAVVS
jgi:pimeloyl-ACP methyl ester carboxylesterase